VRGLGETVEKQIVDEPPSAEKRCPATPYPLYGLASFTSTVSVYAS